MKRRAAMQAVILATLALHGAVIWLLALASRPHAPRSREVHRIAVQLIAPEAPPPVTAPTLPVVPKTRAPIARPAGRPAASAPIAPPTASAAPTGPAVPEPRPPMLHGDATRRALRDMEMNRTRSFSEQADGTLANAPRTPLDARLATAIGAAGKVDCLHDTLEPWGIDVGLGPEYKLPLPGAVGALVKGHCAAPGR